MSKVNPYQSPIAVTAQPSRLGVFVWRLAGIAMFSICPILMTFHVRHELGVGWKTALATGFTAITLEIFGAGAAVLWMASIAAEPKEGP